MKMSGPGLAGHCSCIFVSCLAFHVHVAGDLYGAPFVKILYLTDLAQKVLSLRIYSYLCTDLIISACRDVISGRDSYLCMQR